MASTSGAQVSGQGRNNVGSCFGGAQPFDGPVVKDVIGEIAVPNIDILGKLPYFSMKNGNPDQATSLLVKATIPVAYHWRAIRDLPSERAKEYIGVYVSTAYAAMKADLPPNFPENKLVKAAILIGVSRAVVTTLYGITEGELIPGETKEPLFKALHRGAGMYSFVANDNIDPKYTLVMRESMDLDMQASDVIPSIHMSSIGLPALQGWSLIMCGHHYLSEANSLSRKAYLVVEKQFWRANNVATWWNEDLDLCTDLLWHKSCHPLSISLKTQYATSEQVKMMITIAGAGSAAARLPAKETELRAANSYMVLMQTVRSMFEAYGGRLDYSVLEYVVNLVNSYPVGSMVPQKDFYREAGVPSYVVDRPTALRFLGEVMSSNSDVVAHAFGFYVAMTEQSSLMGTGTSVDTLKTSYSLNKLRNQSTAAYTAGYQAFSDYTAFKAKQRQAGDYRPIRLSIKQGALMPAADAEATYQE